MAVAMNGAGMDVLAEVMSSDPVREALTEPRAVPRFVREHLAEIVARDLLLGEGYETKDQRPSARLLGPLFLIYIAARHTDDWARLRHISSRSRAIALLCVRAALVALLDAFDDAAGQRTADAASQAQAAFERLIAETMALWGRTPGRCDLLRDFPASPGQAGEVASLAADLVRERYMPGISDFLREMEEGADAIELISLLCPGRRWDRGLDGLHKGHLHDIRRYSDIAARSAELQRVVDMLGRQAASDVPGGQAKAPHGRSEVHSVVQSGDLHYMLPSELVKLQEPTLRCLFFARWTEGKLLTYQLSGRARQGTGGERPKGPVVALVDTSGSMSGSPELLAKAVVLAVAKKALKCGRAVQVVLFSSTGQTRVIDLSGGQKAAGEFLEFLRQRFGGGTDFDTALGTGLAALEDRRYNDADLLFVTDGLARVTDEQLLEKWARLRSERGTRLYAVIVGNDNAGGLERVSDGTFVIEDGKGGLTGTMRLTAL